MIEFCLHQCNVSMSAEMEVDEMNSEEYRRSKSRGRKSKHVSVIPAALPDVSLNLEEYWFNAQERLRSNIHLFASTEPNVERDQILGFVNETINTINDSLKTLSAATPIFSELIQSLVDFLNYKNVDTKIHLEIVKIVITLHNRNVILIGPKNFVVVICFLLENCCLDHVDKSLNSFLKDLRKLLINIRNEEIKTVCLEEKQKFMNVLNIVLNRVKFCCSDIGMDVVGCIVALDEDFFKTFHEFVKRLLVSCKRNEALRFGKIYHRIWDLLEEEKKKACEERYIQWLMERAFTLDRRKPPVRCLSLNLQNLLNGLHECRKKTKFSTVITDLYTPILWKYLNSNNNIHRCNAAEIFVSVYPLEKNGRSMKEYSIFLRKQHEEFLALLDDPCPAVRVIAIKGVCSNMCYFWVTFQNGTAEKVIEKFITDLVLDGSSSDVRKAVYHGLTQLLQCEDSHPLLKGVLPSLGGFIHDENESVRQAFIMMLIKLKSLGCSIKYWYIVDIHNVAIRLANDSSRNQQLIVHLIFSSFFNEKVTPEESFKRLCKFISVNPNAIRYLAMYSKQELKFVDAVNMMCLILKIMSNFVKRRMQAFANENKDPEQSTNQPKSKSENKIVENVTNEEDKENITVATVISNVSELTRTTNLSDPCISHGLLDFVGMLWLIHGKTLQRGENKQSLDNVYNAATDCIPTMLRFFKGSHTYFGALNLAAMVPLSKIGHLATVVSSCVSILRQISLDTPENEVHCLVHVLCMWNRGNEVIEIAKEWTDETFRSEALNESFAQDGKKRQRKVRFTRCEAKPILALRLLDVLFNSPTNQKLIFSTDTSELRSLFSYLSRIKILIDRRFEKDSELSALLSDEFLINGLTLYGNLIIMFNENKIEGFNFWRKFTEYLEWCNAIVATRCSAVPDDEALSENQFASKILHVPVVQCLNLIAIGKCKDDQLTILLKLCKATLDSGCGLQFVEVSVQLLKQLILFSRVHHANERQTEIMTVWFPCIVDKLLSLLTDKIYTKEVLSSCIKNIGALKRNIIYIYMLVGKLYPELTHSSPSFKIMYSFCQALVNILLFPITECETLNVDQNLKNMPFVGSFLTSIFMSQFDLSSALLFVFKTMIDRLTEKDGLHLLAATSLLYTLAFGDSKIPKTAVFKIVKLMYQKLQSLSAEEGVVALVMNREQTMADRTIIDVEEATESAVKEVGQHILKKIAEELGGSLS